MSYTQPSIYDYVAQAAQELAYREAATLNNLLLPGTAALEQYQELTDNSSVFSLPPGSVEQPVSYRFQYSVSYPHHMQLSPDGNTVYVPLANGTTVPTPRPSNTSWCNTHHCLTETGTECMYCSQLPPYIYLDPFDDLFDPRD